MPCAPLLILPINCRDSTAVTRSSAGQIPTAERGTGAARCGDTRDVPSRRRPRSALCRRLRARAVRGLCPLPIAVPHRPAEPSCSRAVLRARRERPGANSPSEPLCSGFFGARNGIRGVGGAGSATTCGLEDNSPAERQCAVLFKTAAVGFLAKAAVGHFTASKIPRPILPSGILAEQGSFPHRFPAALRTALPSPLPEQLSSWDGSPAPRPARCQRTVLRLIFPEPLGPALCLLAGGPTAAGDGRVAHVGAPGSVCCRAPVGGGGGGGGSRGAAGWRRRGRVPQQSAAISREREGCVCFCNPPPFFLIVILAVVKGAGLTRHGDGKASGLR